MASPFLKQFDNILYDVLTDYKNLDDAPDTSRGSTAYIMASVLSSMLWGLYRYQDYIQNQHFPDTADTENLNHWGAIYDVVRGVDETDAEYLNDILNAIRQPSAGGNRLDFQNWALDENYCYTTDSGTTYYNAYATIVDIAFGFGTVGVFTIPNDETIIDVVGPPNNEENLRVATENYIESVRPLGLLSVSVISAKPQIQNIEIDLTAPIGVTLGLTLIENAIEDELNSMQPGETLYKSTITCICKNYGAEKVDVTTPAVEQTTVDNDKFIRSGTITLNEV